MSVSAAQSLYPSPPNDYSCRSSLQLPPEINLLSDHLERFSIVNNEIYGSLPSQLGECTELSLLYLGRNYSKARAWWRRHRPGPACDLVVQNTLRSLFSPFCLSVCLPVCLPVLHSNTHTLKSNTNVSEHNNLSGYVEQRVYWQQCIRTTDKLMLTFCSNLHGNSGFLDQSQLN